MNLPQNESSAFNSYLGDRATDSDHLGRSRLVAALASMLRDGGDQHRTIGLFGDAGVGKTSTCLQLCKALRQQEQPFLFAQFDALEYATANNLQAGMAHQVVAALFSDPSILEDSLRQAGIVSRCKRKLAGWLKWRLPLVFRCAFASYAGSVPVLREHLKVLSAARLKPMRLLVFVDNLDQCDHATIVRVFELVQLLLDMPRVDVIVAMDQRRALNALAARYSPIVAREHLARIFQISVTLVPTDNNAVADYLDALHGSANERGEQGSGAGVTVVDRPSGLRSIQQRIFRRWVDHFGFHNPRQLKRLYNSYCLVRCFYGEDRSTQSAKSSSLEALTADLGSPLLITLLALEYVYAQTDPLLREELLNMLRQPRPRSFEEEGDHSPVCVDPEGRINRDVLHVVTGRLPDTELSLIEAVVPFLLPSIMP